MTDPHLWPAITAATLLAGLAATRATDDKAALARGLCNDCETALTDPDANTCIECWRDRRQLTVERDREWWAAS